MEIRQQLDNYNEKVQVRQLDNTVKSNQTETINLIGEKFAACDAEFRQILGQRITNISESMEVEMHRKIKDCENNVKNYAYDNLTVMEKKLRMEYTKLAKEKELECLERLNIHERVDFRLPFEQELDEKRRQYSKFSDWVLYMDMRNIDKFSEIDSKIERMMFEKVHMDHFNMILQKHEQQLDKNITAVH